MTEITFSTIFIIIINLLITVTLVIPGLIGHYLIYPIIIKLMPGKTAIVQGFTSLAFGMSSIGLYQFLYIIPLIKLFKSYEMSEWVKGTIQGANITMSITGCWFALLILIVIKGRKFSKNY